MKTIVCYGDSNTYGYDPRNGLRYPLNCLWTNRLNVLLADEYEVFNEGLNGRTTIYNIEGEEYRNGLLTLIPTLDKYEKIDILVFMLGTNDCNLQLGIDAKDIVVGMEILITEAVRFIQSKQNYVPKIVLVVPAAILDDYHDSKFIEQIDDYSVLKSHQIAPLYKQLATKYNYAYLDASTCVEVSNIDSEHLSEKGHEQLSILLKDVIEKL